MTEFVFKGKEFVHNHHLSIPHRPLVPDASKSILPLETDGQAPPARLDGNLIIHGDNLHALKSLLPLYGGKVDCIFIDPPYNTGNEGWAYNDNVNSPMLQAWLKENPVGIEDGLRHDKWCAMMWPRFKLLHELLAETGSFWMTLDDNEVHRARGMLDEIFGEQNFVACCIWHKMDSPKNTAEFFSVDHDYLLVYAKNLKSWEMNLLPRSSGMLARYKNPDSDPRGPWLLSDLAARNFYAQGQYSIKTKSGSVIDGPPAGSYWRVSESKFYELDADNRIWWGEGGGNRPGIKRFLSEVKDGVVAQTIWNWEDVGSTRNAKQYLSEILGAATGQELFITPKPIELVQRVIDLATNENSIILDSFAGSATTAHAVLAANVKDGGNRQFILVECENYADTLTAERVRRAIHGYAFKGNQREELLRQPLTFTDLKKAHESGGVLDQIAGIENLEKYRFDKIEKKLKDGVLTVEGVKAVQEKVDGLGGSFTFCTLGQPIEMEKLLSGKDLPSFPALGALLFHTATSEVLEVAQIQTPDANGLAKLGESSAWHVWLIYRPELAFLNAPESAFTLDKAKAIAATTADKADGKRHLVFAPARFVSQKVLRDAGLSMVEYSPLPWALYRAERS
ncbi:adenine-specific DNA-methyltransferase [Lampropedia hyalina DSM 16112]|jgi:adenine-specific DNA-methyltransferase|uniref:site-specific DNA-methyltransferase (adenine-specific) n=1 Tax=Lampropedia hyalina DSM 16112 TaxID=1122156 RepID=A0A1M4UJI9_9BURK|nr:site-specific DNA-methyltransferase [Lampropedia hyalina]SHE56906.1 adenine-specific DNA-methyltransferase [Lampropedia hyalina DSM 16112]